MYLEIYIAVKNRGEGEKIVAAIQAVHSEIDWDLNCSGCGDQIDTAIHDDGKFDDKCPNK